MRICVCCRISSDAPPYSTSVPSWQKTKQAIFHLTGKKSLFSFSLPRSTSETTWTTFPYAAPHLLNAGWDSKLSNLTSHLLQHKLNSHRKSHSSTVLQYTGSDTCGLNNSSFLPSLELDERGGSYSWSKKDSQPLTVRQVLPRGETAP